MALSKEDKEYAAEWAESIRKDVQTFFEESMKSASYWKGWCEQARKERDETVRRAETAEKNVLEWQRRDTEARRELAESIAENKALSMSIDGLRLNSKAAQDERADLLEDRADAVKVLRKHASKECRTLLDCAVDVTDQLAALKAFHKHAFGTSGTVEFKVIELDDAPWHTVSVSFDD